MNKYNIVLNYSVDVCPVCGSAEREYAQTHWVEDILPIILLNHCVYCECVYVNPRMTEEAHREFYNEIYREMLPHTVANYTPRQDELRKRLRSESINSQLEYPISSHLDIGCAKGELLEKVNAPFRVGVEWNEIDRNDCLNKGLIVMEELADIDGRFDLITLIQVLEHVERPVDFINNLKRYMEKDGRLIIEVPNVECEFSAVPYHVCNYSERTLRVLVERTSMKINRLYAYKGYRPVDKPYYIFAEFRLDK